jgi:hypothetical protein
VERALSGWRWWAAIVVIAAASIPWVGYAYAEGDLAAYLPLIRHQVDHAYLARDWFVSTDGGIHTFFIWGMAQVSRVVSLPVAFIALHVVERFLFVAGAAALGRELFDDDLAALLGVVIVIVAYPWSPGGNPIVAAVSIPHTLAVVPSIFAFVAALRGRPLRACALAGIATVIHMLVGLEVAMLLLTGIAWRDGVRSSALWRGVAVYGLLALPALLPVFVDQVQTMRTDALPAAEYIAIAGGLRAPWHYLAGTWAPGGFVVLLLYLTVAAPAVQGGLRGPRPAVHRQVLLYGGAIAVLCVASTIAITAFASVLALKLQFFRLAIFVKLFGSLYIARFVSERIRTGGMGRTIGCVTAFAVVDPILFGPCATVLLVMAASDDDVTQRRRLLGMAAVSGVATLVLAFDVLGTWRAADATPGLELSAKKLVVGAGVAIAVALWSFAATLHARRGPLLAAVGGGLIVIGAAAVASTGRDALTWSRVGAALSRRILVAPERDGAWP